MKKELQNTTKGRKLFKSIHKKDNLEFVMLSIPAVLLLIIFNYLPMLGITIAFKDYKPMLGILKSPWVGFGNFAFFFTSQDAVRTIRNTLGYSLTFLILDIIVAVALALMFYYLRNKVCSKVYNTVVILPKFMSAVMVAFMVQILFNHNSGVVNSLLEGCGLPAVKWYENAKYWPLILTGTHIWMTIGINSIIYHASLMGLDDALIEASEIDGANTPKQIWHIILPHLKPVIVISIILNLGYIFNGDFGLFYQVPMDVGLLYPTTDIISTYTFRALQEGSLAKSTAVGLFQSVAGLVMVLGANAVIRKISPEDSLF